MFLSHITPKVRTYDVVNICINVVKCFIIESFEVIIILWLKARVIATLIVTWPKERTNKLPSWT